MGLAEPALPFCGLFGQNMVRVRFGIGYFPCPRNLEALGRASVCLHLWHSVSPSLFERKISELNRKSERIPRPD
jgi:hypothetical protein